MRCGGVDASTMGDRRFPICCGSRPFLSPLVPARVCAVPHLEGRTATERRNYDGRCGWATIFICWQACRSVVVPAVNRQVLSLPL